MERIRYRGGQFQPLLICDICDKRITDGHQGLVVYHGNMVEDELTQVWHIHKAAPCQSEMERRMAATGQTMAAEEVVTHLLVLAENTGLTVTDLKSVKDMRATFESAE
jgi:hypothetical protein